MHNNNNNNNTKILMPSDCVIFGFLFLLFFLLDSTKEIGIHDVFLRTKVSIK